MAMLNNAEVYENAGMEAGRSMRHGDAASAKQWREWMQRAVKLERFEDRKEAQAIYDAAYKKAATPRGPVSNPKARDPQHRKLLKSLDTHFARDEKAMRKNPRDTANEHHVRELTLYADNARALQNQRNAIILNLLRKYAAGKYDRSKAWKLWKYWFDSAAQAYTKEFDAPGRSSFGAFSAADREQAAKDYAIHLERMIADGEFDWMIHEKGGVHSKRLTAARFAAGRPQKNPGIPALSKRIFELGRKAALSGARPAENPYKIGTQARTEWHQGFLKGAGELIAAEFVKPPRLKNPGSPAFVIASSLRNGAPLTFDGDNRFSDSRKPALYRTRIAAQDKLGLLRKHFKTDVLDRAFVRAAEGDEAGAVYGARPRRNPDRYMVTLWNEDGTSYLTGYGHGTADDFESAELFESKEGAEIAAKKLRESPLGKSGRVRVVVAHRRNPAWRELKCDMAAGCHRPVTHIGEKGYLYCRTHSPQRAGVERVRELEIWERKALENSEPVFYRKKPRPKN